MESISRHEKKDLVVCNSSHTSKEEVKDLKENDIGYSRVTNSQEVSSLTQGLSANQLAAKVLQLRMKGRHEEAEQLSREMETMIDKPDTINKVVRQGTVLNTSRYFEKKISSEQKRREEDSDLHLAQTIMRNKQYSMAGGADDEYDYDGDAPSKKRNRKREGMHEVKQNIPKRILTQQERCQFCFENPSRPKHLIVSVGNFTYMMLPQLQPVVQGHCCILPMQHETSTRTVDKNVWEEIHNFKKCLLRMFAAEDKDVVFVETVINLSRQCRHGLINCIPIPYVVAKQAPGYFKKKFWEAGGNCNLAIAAARLGLHVFTLGHVGNEVYGHFLLDVLQNESISMVGMNDNSEAANHSALYETLCCWVLVDPFQKHGFCSRADFSDELAFSWMTRLSDPVKTAIQQSKILFCNGYAFDEFFPDLINSALHCAIDAGTSVFFDPGPRGRTLVHGTPELRGALELYLRFSDVLLLTLDEVESLTGIKNPILAGQELIRKGVRTKWVIVKLGSKGSILITQSSICCAPAFKVNVVDTVGCGDSYTAAIAFGYLHDLPAVNTLTLANAVGAATATGIGAGRNVATLDKVLELLRQSNLSEDDKFWSELFEDNLEAQEVSLLSKTPINGYGNRFVCIPVQSVVSQLLPKFKAGTACERTVLQS